MTSTHLLQHIIGVNNLLDQVALILQKRLTPWSVLLTNFKNLTESPSQKMLPLNWFLCSVFRSGTFFKKLLTEMCPSVDTKVNLTGSSHLMNLKISTFNGRTYRSGDDFLTWKVTINNILNLIQPCFVWPKSHAVRTSKKSFSSL